DSILASTPAFIGRRNPAAPFKGRIDEVRVYGRELPAEEVRQLLSADSIRQILAFAPEKRTAAQKETLLQYYAEHSEAPYRKLTADLAEARKKRNALDTAIPTTMVMQEMPKPRDTFILVRGQYDRKGEQVTPGVPAALPPLP